MVIELDFASDTPIYVQLRNQIVKGIGKGELKAGEAANRKTACCRCRSQYNDSQQNLPDS